MPSMEDFVEHRWADAKEVMRQLDPEFVNRLEMTTRAQAVGLEMPYFFDLTAPPRKSLPKHWHRFLESCELLSMQVTPVTVAAEGLQALASTELSEVEAGKLADYHLRSWFAHMLALVERTQKVIEQTVEVYLANPDQAKHISGPWTEDVWERVGKRIKRQRNDYLHANRSPASAVTEDKLWEGLVAVGMTPGLFLEDFHYPAEAERVTRRFRNAFMPGTLEKLESLGQILEGLERDLAEHGDRKYSFSTGIHR